LQKPTHGKTHQSIKPVCFTNKHPGPTVFAEYSKDITEGTTQVQRQLIPPRLRDPESLFCCDWVQTTIRLFQKEAGWGM